MALPKVSFLFYNYVLLRYYKKNAKYDIHKKILKYRLQHFSVCKTKKYKIKKILSKNTLYLYYKNALKNWI